MLSRLVDGWNWVEQVWEFKQKSSPPTPLHFMAEGSKAEHLGIRAISRWWGGCEGEEDSGIGGGNG